MSNKIKELAGQALDKVVPYTWTNLNYDELWALQEYFGKLIVKECIAICRDIDGEDNIDARSGRQDCAVEIREHFGVGE